jgi:hypothetical protein
MMEPSADPAASRGHGLREKLFIAPAAQLPADFNALYGEKAAEVGLNNDPDGPAA